MKKNVTKRILCLFLTLALLMGNVPVAVFATDEELPAATETVVPEETSAPTVAPTEPPAAETEAATEAPQPEETVASTEQPTEPVAETVPPTEPDPTEIPGDTVTVDPALVASGSCGTDVKWELREEIVLILTISGTGEMENFELSNQPWKEYAANIEEIVIEEGVRSIGDYAFYNCSSILSITIPDTVTTIGNSAFYGCTGLRRIVIPDSVTRIGNSAFEG